MKRYQHIFDSRCEGFAGRSIDKVSEARGSNRRLTDRKRRSPSIVSDTMHRETSPAPSRSILTGSFVDDDPHVTPILATHAAAPRLTTAESNAVASSTRLGYDDFTSDGRLFRQRFRSHHLYPTRPIRLALHRTCVKEKGRITRLRSCPSTTFQCRLAPPKQPHLPLPRLLFLYSQLSKIPYRYHVCLPPQVAPSAPAPSLPVRSEAGNRHCAVTGSSVGMENGRLSLSPGSTRLCGYLQPTLLRSPIVIVSLCSGAREHLC